MTFVGKVLVVVNVFLTIAVAIFAAGVHSVQTNWKTEAEKRQKDFEAADALNKKWKVTYDEARAKWEKEELLPLRKKVTEIEGNQLDKKIQQANDDALTALRGSLSASAAERDLLKSKIDSLKQQNSALDKALKQLHVRQDQLVKNIAATLDELYEEKRKNRDVERRYNRLVKLHAAAVATLVANEIDIDLEKAANLTVPPKPAEGIVVDVVQGNRERATLVEISVGRDDGVTRGQSLFIYRIGKDPAGKDSKYLGKVKVVFVTADRAVATLVDDARNGDIKEGDNVSEKL